MAAKYGTRGSDSLTASAGSTELFGQAGNDTLRSGSIAGVSLFGEEGNDALYAKDTDTLIDGGAGVDTAYFGAAVSSANLSDADLEGVENIVITNASAGAYDFSAQSEGLNITGSRVVDTITGGSGNDTITGGLGADSLVGGLGDDLLVAEATDAMIDGGAGTADTVRFATAVTTANLTNAKLVNVENVVIASTGAAKYDFSVQNEALNITGSKFADTIVGGTVADTLAGGAGNDRLEAASTDALVDGGEGTDTVVYAADVSSLTDAELTRVEKVVITKGSGGTYDFSSQSEGLDITGTQYDDIIKGGSGSDALRGGLGADTLHAGDNDTLIDGGNGADTAVFVSGVSAKNLLDSELVNVETVSITGTGAYDFSVQSEKLVITATGLTGAVTITGGKGVDTITGGDGGDLIVASDTDVITGGAGTDTVRFTAAVSAANLTDTDLNTVENIELSNTRAAAYDFSVQAEVLNITGSGSNDTITGGSAADTISGGAGNDVLVAADNDALIDGGAGTDTLRVGAAITTALTDLKLANVELIEITNTGNATYDFSLQTESLQITGNKGVDNIQGGFRADTITGGEGADALYGNDGADVIVADASDTLVDGGDGDDTVRYAAGVSGLANGELINVEFVEITNTGNAAYDFSGQTEVLSIAGNRGADTITGGSGADTISGGLGNDVLVAEATDALIDGGAGTDTVKFGTGGVSATDLLDADLVNVERIEITSTGTFDFSTQTEAFTIAGNSGGDTIYGGSAADSITGGTAADKLYGNAGADTLVGGAGADTLTGGAGADSLLGGDGVDVLVAEDTDALIDGGSNVSSDPSAEIQQDKVQFGAAVSATNLLDADMVGIERVEITNTTSDATYDFSAQTEALVIVGNSRADTIIGTKDWDEITGGGGNDSLTGGAGLDTFNVDSGTDTITDLAAGETLTVSASATAIVSGSLLDLTLATVTNSGTINITGTSGNDVIKGSTTSGGIDVINGGVGADTATGGAGVDKYVIVAGDSVFTNGTTAQGDSAALDKIMDFVLADDLIVISGAISGTTFSVASNVVIGTASGSATGDNQDNVGDFVNSTYLVDLDGVATTFELGLNVTTNGSTAAFSSLADARAATVLNVTGTTGDDSITGGANADTISGGDGADVITGGAGVDVISLGAGADTLVFNSLVGADTIVDYLVADDSIQLSRATFTALGAVGALSAGEFVSGAAVVSGADATDRIAYNTTTGNLYYDADGNGAGAAVLIGTFTGAPGLAVSEFTIVS